MSTTTPKAGGALDVLSDALYLPVQKWLQTESNMTMAMALAAAGSGYYLWQASTFNVGRPAAWALLSYSGFYLLQRTPLWHLARDKTDEAK